MNTELINDSTNQEHLGNTINNDTLENIKQLLTTFRLDIKNYGREENTVKIIADNCTVSAPTWYKDTQGQGITIEGTNKTQQIIIKVINDGNLRLCFKGQDKRCNAQRIPVWIDYKSIKIDGKEILSVPISTWHDKPYIYEFKVHDKQTIIVEFEVINIHQYPHDYMKDIILNLQFTDTYVIKNIETIINKLSKNRTGEYLKVLPCIESNHFISLGKNCKEAFWLKQFNLRRCSLPFDWMVNYNLSFVISTLKKGIDIWLNNWHENKDYNGKFRQIQDLDSGMIIQHCFPKHLSITSYIEEFKEIFQRRINRFKKILQSGGSICFLCDRDETIDTRIEFLLTLQSMYPSTKFIMINIIHSPESKKIYKYQMSNILLLEIYANNYHENNGKFKNEGWIGNEKLMEEICSNLRLLDTI